MGQGFVSRNASRNTRGRGQDEVQLLPLISCSNETTSNLFSVTPFAFKVGANRLSCTLVKYNREPGNETTSNLFLLLPFKVGPNSNTVQFNTFQTTNAFLSGLRVIM